MRLFTVKWHDTTEGPQCEWYPNENAACSRVAQLGNVGQEDAKAAPVDLPTRKLDMCVFLNHNNVGSWQ